MEKEQHDCIHEEDFTKLYTLLETRDKKLYNEIQEINTKLGEGSEQFNKISKALLAKKINDKHRNGKIKDDGEKLKELDDRVDKIEQTLSRLSWLNIVLTGLLGGIFSVMVYILIRSLQ